MLRSFQVHIKKEMEAKVWKNHKQFFSLLCAHVCVFIFLFLPSSRGPCFSVVTRYTETCVYMFSVYFSVVYRPLSTHYALDITVYFISLNIFCCMFSFFLFLYIDRLHRELCVYVFCLLFLEGKFQEKNEFKRCRLINKNNDLICFFFLKL